MESKQSAFAIYTVDTQVQDATDTLIANGFGKQDVLVLCPKNKDTREFARRNGTHAPWGTDEGQYANIPLKGTWGILKPGRGPQMGALHDALIDMGVPEEWCDRRVVQGKFLIAVRCMNRDELIRALGILKLTGACDSSWRPAPDRYWERAL
jgi:hypothetical protein